LKKKKFLQSITSKTALEEILENFRHQEGRPTKISDMTLEQLNEEMKMISFLMNLVKELRGEKRKTNIINWLNQITDTVQQKRRESEEETSQSTKKLKSSTSQTRLKKVSRSKETR